MHTVNYLGFDNAWLLFLYCNRSLIHLFALALHLSHRNKLVLIVVIEVIYLLRTSKIVYYLRIIILCVKLLFLLLDRRVNLEQFLQVLVLFLLVLYLRISHLECF